MRRWVGVDKNIKYGEISFNVSASFSLLNEKNNDAAKIQNQKYDFLVSRSAPRGELYVLVLLDMAGFRGAVTWRLKSSPKSSGRCRKRLLDRSRRVSAVAYERSLGRVINLPLVSRMTTREGHK